jgi:hypothetical protein
VSARTITGEVGVYMSPYLPISPADLASRDGSELMGKVHLCPHSMPSEYARIGSATVTVTFNSTDDIVTGRVDALQAEQRRLKGEAEAAVTKLERQIQRLLAITHEVTA